MLFTLTPGRASLDTFGAAATEALVARATGEGQLTTPAARELEHATLMDVATEALRLSGRSDAKALPPAYLAEAAIQASYDSMNSPGSFPNILSATANKIAERPADDAVVTFRQWTFKARKSLPDFKPASIIHVGEFGEFPEHVDGQPFEQSTFSTETNWIQIGSFGDELALTPQMIVDDDLDVFSDTIQDKATAHDLTLQRLCIELLVNNVILSDTYNLFDAAQHGNDLPSGAAPSEAELSNVRRLLRQQQGVSGKRTMAYDLFGILIPTQIETDAEKLLADLNVIPAAAADAEIYRGRVRYWPEPMLDGYSTAVWYGFANPARARGIIVCYQQGFETMKLRTYVDQRTNNLVYQCEGRFAAAVRNYRGIVRNPGE